MNITYKERVEREAHEFAMNLLMPEDLVRSAAAKMNNGQGLLFDEDVETLARKFQVSTPRMTMRLLSLKIIKVA